VEAADVQGEVVPPEQALASTQAARGELTAARVDPFRWQPEVWRFLEQRARALDALQTSRGGGAAMAMLTQRLRLPRVPGMLLTSGALVALAGGFGLMRLGNERELNLLAVPLVGLLLWNAVVMLGALLLDLRNSDAAGVARWLGQKLRSVRPREDNEAEGPVVTRASREFEKLTETVSGPAFGRQVRRLLHVGAALVALGSVLGLFAQGWSREYRVVWESTLLDEAGMTRFAGLLFTPASRVFDIDLPLEALPAMRRGAGLETQAAPARVWLQLYAGTLVLGIALPRLLLALASLAWEHQRLRRALLEQGWGAHALRLLRRVEGAGRRLLVLSAASAGDERVRQRWAGWLAEMVGGRVELGFEPVPEEAQDPWVEAWQPADGRVAVVFYLAATPEEEVQRAWLLRLRQRLREHHHEPEVLVVLDATGLNDRWSPEKRTGRELLWLDMLAGAADQLWKADEAGPRPLGRTQLPL
jgi:hypothetical protein